MMDESNGQLADAAFAFSSAGAFLAGYRWGRKGFWLKIVSVVSIGVGLFLLFAAEFTK
jgi:hypothetical protein